MLRQLRALHTCTPAGFQQVLRDLRRLAAASLADNNSDGVALHQVQDLFPATSDAILLGAEWFFFLEIVGCIHSRAKHQQSLVASCGTRSILTQGTLLPTNCCKLARCCKHRAPVLVNGQTPALFAERKAGVGIVDDRAACIAPVCVKGE